MHKLSLGSGHRQLDKGIIVIVIVYNSIFIDILLTIKVHTMVSMCRLFL